MAGTTRGKLLIKDAGFDTEFLLPEGVTTIGRMSDNDIVIDEKIVSRQHATITVAGDAYTLADLKSANGSKVGGAAVQSHPLKDGDVVQIGSASMTFKLLASEEAANAPAPDPAKRQKVRVGPPPGMSKENKEELARLVRLLLVACAALVLAVVLGGYVYSREGGWPGVLAWFKSKVSDPPLPPPGASTGKTAALGRNTRPEGVGVIGGSVPESGPLPSEPASADEHPARAQLREYSLEAEHPFVAKARADIRQGDIYYRSYWGIAVDEGPRYKLYFGEGMKVAKAVPTIPPKTSHLWDSKLCYERAARILGATSPRPYEFQVATERAARVEKEIRAIVREKGERADRLVKQKKVGEARKELLSVTELIPDEKHDLHRWAVSRYRSLGG